MIAIHVAPLVPPPALPLLAVRPAPPPPPRQQARPLPTAQLRCPLQPERRLARCYLGRRRLHHPRRRPRARQPHRRRLRLQPRVRQPAQAPPVQQAAAAAADPGPTLPPPAVAAAAAAAASPPPPPLHRRCASQACSTPCRCRSCSAAMRTDGRVSRWGGSKGRRGSEGGNAPRMGCVGACASFRTRARCHSSRHRGCFSSACGRGRGHGRGRHAGRSGGSGAYGPGCGPGCGLGCGCGACGRGHGCGCGCGACARGLGFPF